MWRFISKYLLLQVSHLPTPTPLLSLLGLLPRWAAVVPACRHYHCGEKNLSQQYYTFLFHFALAMTIVSLTAKAMATTMAMLAAMIYHHLFHDSDEAIVHPSNEI